MKRLYIYIVLLAFSWAGCSDFLEYKDNDKIIPRTLDHYDELVYGELIKKTSGSEMMIMDFMTDDVMSFVAPLGSGSRTESRGEYHPYFTWAKDHHYDMENRERQDGNWGFFYNRILMCNIIEHDLSAFEEDYDRVKTRLLGEVAFIRAMAYYYLVNLYGEPYKDAAQAKEALGVPINEAISIETHTYTRAKLQTVYDLIETNLLNAISLLEKGDQAKSIFRPNVNVARLFLSRIYLIQKRWEDARDMASELITTSGATIETLENMKTYHDKSKVLYNSGNKGVIYSWGKRSQSPVGGNVNDEGRWEVNTELRNMFVDEEGKKDIRGKAFFSKWSPYPPKKYDAYTRTAYDWSYRIEEAYLNRAEAYIEIGDAESVALAMRDINRIREQRIEGDFEKAATTAAEARQILRDEKRMEFCFEDTRWFDIRRWELEIKHVFQDINTPLGGDTYVLRAGSPNYVLNVPKDVLERNMEIERIEREETLVGNK